MNLSKRDIKKIIKILTNKRLPIFSILIAILAVFVFIFENNFSGDQANDNNSYLDYPFSVSFIDVGQGDCSLISCNGINILVDGGEAQYANEILSYFKKNDINKIDCYILSHPHSDHVGSAATIMRSVDCDTVFTTYFSEFNVPTSYLYENLVDTIYEYANHAVAVEAGDTYKFGDLEIEILAPITESDDYNEMSVVFTATYKSSTVLFTGDTTTPVEKQILSAGMNVDADVIKIAHHGSSTSNTPEFINAVNPEIAVISYGSGNDYGHPHKEVINLLKKEKIDYYSTAEGGNTVIKIDNGKLVVEQER